MKITNFFKTKKTSASRLPETSLENELSCSQDNFLSPELNITSVSSFINSSIEIDPASSIIPFNNSLKAVRPELKVYPKNVEGNKFKKHWYTDFSWLEYSKSKNAAFCFVCRHFGENSGYTNNLYTNEGFTNFRRGPQRFKEHADSSEHKTEDTKASM